MWVKFLFALARHVLPEIWFLTSISVHALLIMDAIFYIIRVTNLKLRYEAWQVKNVPLRHVQTPKTQIRLHRYPVWSGLSCPLLESLDTIECINGKQRPGLDLVHTQDDVTPHILCMLKGTFLLGVLGIYRWMCGNSKFLSSMLWDGVLE